MVTKRHISERVIGDQYEKIVKNTTVVALSGVMAIGMLSGCGSKSIDGEKTVATVDAQTFLWVL